MTGIADGRLDFSADGVAVVGIKALARDAEKAAVSVTDLKDLTYRLALPIAARGATLAPSKTGRMAGMIKPSKSKVAVRVRVGSERRMPYAGRVHWGNPGDMTPPLFLSRAEEELRQQTFAGFGRGIVELLRKQGW